MEKRGVYVTGNSPPCFLQVYTARSRQSRQGLHRTVPQPNSNDDATSSAEEPATGGRGNWQFTNTAFFCTCHLTSQATVSDKSKTQEHHRLSFKKTTTIQRTPRGRLFRGGCDIASGVQAEALLCSRIGNPCLLCTLPICRNKDRDDH